MNSAERFRRIDELFRAALRLDQAERDSFLRERCRDDPSLIEEVGRLLGEDAAGSHAIDRPALGCGVDLNALAEADVPPARLPESIGGYRIVSLLGLGGMGAVYEAEQRDPQRRVALKVIRAGSVTPETLHRFRQEAQVLGQLTHPGIAQIYEAGTADDGDGPQPYFVMELVRGSPVNEFAHAGRLSLRQRLELIARIADALQHAHAKGIIHRDLKPANILVDDSGQPKILDFGIARATDADIHTVSLRTDAGQLVGTIAYMSPEQAGGNPTRLDARSDVYSLGVVAYELLTGRLPYDVRDKMIHEAVRIIREVDPTAASTVSRKLAGDVETIIGKALEKDPARRYLSAIALADDIRRFLTDQPIIARPPSTWYQFGKFTKRNKAAVIGAACVFGALALGLAGTSTALVQTTVARNAEREERERASNLAMEADVAATRAQREARKAERIAGFSRSILTGITPDVARDEDTTLMRMILDDAAERVEAELNDQPEIEASIRLLIGQSYRAIAEPDLAAPHVQQAVAIYRRELGEDSRESLTALNELANVFIDQGEYRRAEDLQSKLLEHARRTLTANDPLLVKIVMGYGGMLNALGQHRKAEAMARETLELARTALGDDDPLTITAMHNLGILLHAQQRPAEAEPYFRNALEAVERVGRSENRLALKIRGNLGRVLTELGKVDEAEALLQETIALQRRILGDRHPETLEVLTGYGLLLSGIGRFADAERVHHEVMMSAQEARGENHPMTLQSRNHLAYSVAQQGRLEEAEVMFRKSVDAHRRVLGQEHRHALQATRSLVDFLRFRGKVDEAVALSEEMVDIARRALPADDWQLGWQLAVRGRVLLDAGRADEAEPILREARDILAAAMGDEDRRTRIAHNALAEARAGSAAASTPNVTPDQAPPPPDRSP